MPVTTSLAMTAGVTIAALCFIFACFYIREVRKRTKQHKNFRSKTPRWLRVLTIGGALVTACVIGYVFCFYSFMVFLDDNLAYMAMFYDDMAVDMYQDGQDFEAVMTASTTAMYFCELYRVEKRQIDFNKYEPLCSAISNRTMLLYLCDADPLGELCSDTALDELDRLIELSEYLGKELKENRPYFGFVFRPDYSAHVCYLGGIEVPCVV